MKRFKVSNKIYFSVINLSLVVLALGLVSCSDNKTQHTHKLPPPPVEKHKTPIPPKAAYCPTISDLVKRGLTWGTSSGWRTHNPSFSTKISAFEGAQWQGVMNGKILCIYKGSGKDFPVILQTNQYVQAPWGRGWKELHVSDVRDQRRVVQKSYVKNCHATDVLRCPFPSAAHFWRPKQKVNPNKPIPK